MPWSCPLNTLGKWFNIWDGNPFFPYSVGYNRKHITEREPGVYLCLILSLINLLRNNIQNLPSWPRCYWLKNSGTKLSLFQTSRGSRPFSEEKE